MARYNHIDASSRLNAVDPERQLLPFARLASRVFAAAPMTQDGGGWVASRADC